ncbi:MAG: STAS domain-containing protein [Candidatus Kapaibacteriales bacterium]
MSKIKVQEQIGGLVIFLKGEFIGGDETDELRKTLREITDGPKNKIIIDMGNVTYLNSTALGVLISAHESITKKGGKIVLCNLDKSIENLFVITKLTLVFPIYATLEEAIKNIY